MDSKLICDSCDLRFTSKTTLKIHSYLIHSQETPRVKAFMVVALIQQGCEKLKCDICNSGFALEKHLSEHKSSCHKKEEHIHDFNYDHNTNVPTNSEDDKQIKCELCEKSFCNKSTQEKHVLAVQEGKRPYSCQICDKNFSYKSNLKVHIKAVHEQNKPHICHICDYSFTLRTSLVRHIQSVHEGIKPY